jgi:hypothetical protein
LAAKDDDGPSQHVLLALTNPVIPPHIARCLATDQHLLALNPASFEPVYAGVTFAISRRRLHMAGSSVFGSVTVSGSSANLFDTTAAASASRMWTPTLAGMEATKTKALP